MLRAIPVGCVAISDGWFKAATTDGNVQIVGDIDASRAEARAAQHGFSCRADNDLRGRLAKLSLPDFFILGGFGD